MKDFLQALHDDALSIFEFGVNTTATDNVPTASDPGLTFSLECDKKGKLLETCVLFVDIRNSTTISKRLHKKKDLLGKLYSAFIHAMVHIADEYGYVRNIVGDRVMVVFEPKNCFEDALNCASVMNVVAKSIIGKFAKTYAGVENFKVGIGVDWGEMLILKTGKVKRFREASEYKGLVWVGDAANNASKLTDFAARDHYSCTYHLTYERLEYQRTLKQSRSFDGSNEFAVLIASLGQTFPKPEPQFEMKWVSKKRFASLSSVDFDRLVKIVQNGPSNFEMRYESYLVTSCEKKVQSFTAPSILVSGRIPEGLKKQTGGKHPYLSRLTQQQYPNAPYVGGGIYSAILPIKEIHDIK